MSTRHHQQRKFGTYTHEAHGSQSECGVQNDSEVDVLLLAERSIVLLSIATAQTVQVLDRDSERGVRQHPERDETRTEGLVLIVHGGLLDLLSHLQLRNGTRHSLLEMRIQIFLVPGDILDDGNISILRLLRRDGGQRLGLVATLRTPRHLSKKHEYD